MRDDERQQLKIGLLSQWKLEAEFRKKKSFKDLFIRGTSNCTGSTKPSWKTPIPANKGIT